LGGCGLMEQISIIAPDKTEYLRNVIFNETKSNISIENDTKKINISLENWSLSKYKFINIIYNYIVENYENNIIRKVIECEYAFLSYIEKNQVYEFAISLLRDENNIFSKLFREKSREVISSKLEDYFENCKEIIIDGFVNFRLKEYRDEVGELVEKAVDEFLVEKEYKEFLMLLNYFVEIQESKIDTINIIKKNNKYLFLDQNGKEIDRNFINDIACELTSDKVEDEDLIISSLITFAPKKIVIHNISDIGTKLIKMIEYIFQGKVIKCTDCEICKPR
jgi:putative sporulation protein YtxC